MYLLLATTILDQTSLPASPLNISSDFGGTVQQAQTGGSGTLIGSTNSSYRQGELWSFGNPPFGLDGPGTWYPNGAGNHKIELAFSTFVDVPEPGTLGLLVFAFGTLPFFLHKRRSQKQIGKFGVGHHNPTKTG